MTAVPSTVAARAFVAGLIRAGIRDVCITPGSRSTPLTLAFAEQPAVRPWLHLDERSSSYFALGMARATGRPTALVCTSGTAASNYAPAVTEAHQSRIPLIVCTTDRPPRLRDRGADQTIHQVGMFGPNARLALDLPILSEGVPSRVFSGFAERAVRAALGPLPGPVHVNFPFDEPLVEPPGRRPPAETVAPGLPVARANVAPPAWAIAEAARLLGLAHRPLVVAGPETGGLPADVGRLARELGAPLLADPLSGFRSNLDGWPGLVDAYDAFLRDPASSPPAPDCVLRFGGVPTSKALNQFLARAAGATHIVVDMPGGVRDPDALASLTIEGDPELVAAALIEAQLPPASDSSWLAGWAHRGRAAREALRQSALAFNEPFEGRVFIELNAALPEGSTVMAGNSMPVRDLDAFFETTSRDIRFVANRGVNGIDGVVSSALGEAAATDRPVFLVIGDLSFYHDMNGLWAAKRHGIDLTIVLVNNDGGGIFHYLPQAEHNEVFEPWFGTSLGIDLAEAVHMYGGTHLAFANWGRFREAIAGGSAGLRVIELRTDRYRNAEMHREAWAAACRAAAATADPVTA